MKIERQVKPSGNLRQSTEFEMDIRLSGRSVKYLAGIVTAPHVGVCKP